MTDVAISLAAGAATASVTGSVQAGGATFAAALAVAAASSAAAAPTSFTLTTSDTTSLAALDAQLSSGGEAAVSAPAELMKVRAAAITVTSAALSIPAAQLTISGSVSSPFAATVRYSSEVSAAGEWGYSFAVDRADSFTLSSLLSATAIPALDGLTFTAGGAVLVGGAESEVQGYAMPSTSAATTSLTLAAGKVTLLATAAASQVLDEVDNGVKWGAAAGSEVPAVGTLDASSATSAITIAMPLPGSTTLGPHAAVKGEGRFTVDGSGAAGSFSLAVAEASITLTSPFPAISCDDATLTAPTSDDLQLTCSAASYKLDVGTTGLTATDVTVTLTGAAAGEDFTGSLSGSTTIGAADLTLSLQLPVPDDDGRRLGEEQGRRLAGGAIIALTLEQGHTISVGDAFHSLNGGVVPDLKYGFEDLLNYQLSAVDISLDTSLPALTISTTMKLFRLPTDVEVEVMFGKDDDGALKYAVGVGITDEFKLSDVITFLPSSVVNLVPFNFGSAGMIYTNTDDPWTLTIPHTAGMTAFDGWAMQMVTPLEQGILKPIASWAHLDDVTIRAQYTDSTKDMRFSVDLGVDWAITSGFEVSDVDMFMDIGGPLKFGVGLGIDLDVKVGGDDLTFEGEIEFGLDEMSFGAALTTPWQQPFGAKGVTIGDTKIDFGISYELDPTDLGLAGSVTVGDVTGSGAIYVTAEKPEDAVLAFSLTNFNLLKLVEAMTSLTVPAGIGQVVLGASAKALSFSYNGGEDPVSFNDVSYPDGLRVDIQQLALLGGFLTGSATLQMDDEDFELSVSVDPIEIGPSGEVLKLTGYHCDSCPATLSVAFGKRFIPPHASMSVTASILGGLLQADGSVSISDEGVHVELSFVEGALTSAYSLQLPGLDTPHTDASISAVWSDDTRAYLDGTVRTFLQKAQQSADASFNAAKAKVGAWEQDEEPQIAAKEAQINSILAGEKAKLSDAENKLNAAKGKLSSAQAKVDSLQGKIDHNDGDKEHCRHWYDFSCKAKDKALDVANDALYASMKIADAALSGAEHAIKPLEDAVAAAGKVADQANPQVLALRTEIGTIQAAGAAAKATLSAAEKTTNGALKAASFAASAVANTFQLTQASFSASSLLSLKTAGKVSFGVQGVLLGKTFSYDLVVPFPPSLDAVGAAIVEEVKKVF